MLGCERVVEALAHREPDRVPLYCWIFGQPGVIDDIHARYGSMEAFADALDFDVHQAFPAGGLLDWGVVAAHAQVELDPAFGRVMSIEEAVEVPLTDPSNPAIYEPIRRAVAYEKGQRGRFVLVQTPGVFECSNGFLGLQGHLMAAALEPELCRRLYDRIAAWDEIYIATCAEIGVDCIHVSDDWGGQNALLFRPDYWHQVIAPPTREIARHAKSRGLYLSLHSDGDISAVMDGLVDIGFDMAHPVQESAGMDMLAIKQRYAGRLALYGGLDVQTVLGRGDPRHVEDEVRRLMRTLKPGGGYIFCTSHMVQPGTPLDEVVRAFEVAREEAVY